MKQNCVTRGWAYIHTDDLTNSESGLALFSWRSVGSRLSWRANKSRETIIAFLSRLASCTFLTLGAWVTRIPLKTPVASFSFRSGRSARSYLSTCSLTAVCTRWTGFTFVSGVSVYSSGARTSYRSYNGKTTARLTIKK